MDRVPRRRFTGKVSDPLEKKISLLTFLIGLQVLFLAVVIVLQLFPVRRSAVRDTAEPVQIQEQATSPADVKQAEPEAADVGARAESEKVEPKVPVRETGNLPPEVPLDRPVRVEILNGCGVPKLAARFGEKLRVEGYDIRDKRNADRLDYSQSLIYDRTELPGQARRLAELLGISPDRVIVKKDPNLVDVDLTLILGSDYKQFNITP